METGLKSQTNSRTWLKITSPICLPRMLILIIMLLLRVTSWNHMTRIEKGYMGRFMKKRSRESSLICLHGKHQARQPPSRLLPENMEHNWSQTHWARERFPQQGQYARRLKWHTRNLIPKVSQPEFVTQLQPISLCNIAYKLITKVIVNKAHDCSPEANRAGKK